MLKTEIIKSLRGESSFPKDILSTMIGEAEKKCSLLQEQLTAAQAAYDEGQAVMASLSATTTTLFPGQRCTTPPAWTQRG